MTRLCLQREGHERVVPAAPELHRLRERAAWSIRHLARQIHPDIDGMTEAAVRMALVRMGGPRHETVRRGLYEAATEALQAAIVARDGTLSPLDVALLGVIYTTPYLAAVQDHVAWAREGIAEHEGKIRALQWYEAQQVERLETHERLMSGARATLAEAERAAPTT